MRLVLVIACGEAGSDLHLYKELENENSHYWISGILTDAAQDGCKIKTCVMSHSLSGLLTRC